MAEWRCLGNKEELAKKKCQHVFAEGGKAGDLALFYADDKFYALEAWCQHQGGPLFNGSVLTKDIEDIGSVKAVQCPWHGYMFKLDNGEHTDIPGLAQKTYEVKVAEDKVYVNSDKNLSMTEFTS